MPIEILERRFKIRGSFTFSRVSERTSKFVRLPMKSRLIRVDAKFRDVKKTWYKAGYLNPIHNGITSKGIPIKFGTQLIVLPNLLPYTLEFFPVSWLPDGYLRISEYLLPLTNEELIQISLDSPNPPSLSTVLTLLNMAQSDTRAILTTVSGLQTALTNTQQSIVAQFVTMSGNMVQEFKASLNKIDFVQSGSVYVASVTHTLNNASPQLDLFDAQGDEQGLAQLIAISATQIKVELTVDQWNDNAYPLKLVIQGTKAALSTNPLPPVPVPGTNFAVRYNPGKSGGALEWSDNAGQSYTVAAGASNVKELYLSQGSIFSLDDSNIYKITVPGTWTWNPSDAAAYAVAVTGTLIGKRSA